MQNVRCRIWRGVDCGASLCGMLHNAKCGKLGDVKCGGVELWRLMKNVAYAMCCGCVMSDVENDAMCCDVSCGGVTL